MQAFRSLLFSNIFFGTSTIFLVAALLLLLFPRHAAQKCFQIWMKYMMWLLRVLVGLDYKIVGAEHLPDGPVIVACKHQSTWDVGIFLILFSNPAYVLKKELLSIPVYGWLLRKTKMIAINRQKLDGPSIEEESNQMFKAKTKTVSAKRLRHCIGLRIFLLVEQPE